MNLFELQASVLLNSDQFNSGIDSATERGESFGASFGRVAAGIGKAAVAITGAALAVGGTLAGVAISVANTGNEIALMSDRLGMSTQTYQEWDYILRQNGSSTYYLSYGVRNLSNMMGGSELQANKLKGAMGQLGSSFEALEDKSPAEAFDYIVRLLQDMPEGAEKTALAMQLLGRRGGMELMPLLNGTAESMDVLRERAHELGAIMSEETIYQSQRLNNALTDMGQIVTGLKMRIGEALIPSLVEGAEALVNMFLGVEGAEEEFQNAIDTLINTIAEKVPKFIENGSVMILSFVQGIASALPDLVKGAMPVIPTIIETILGMLPELFQVGVDILVAVIEGIADMLPELVPLAVETILTLYKAFVENVPLLIDAALQIIMGLVEGVINAIPIIVEMAPKIINALVEAFTKNVSLIIQAGIDLLVALVEALPKIITAIIEAIPIIIDGIITALMDNLPLIIQAGIDLFIALIQALPVIIATLVEAIPQIIDGILTAIIENLDQIIMGGVMLFMALITNLPTIIIEIIRAVGQITASIFQAFIDFLPRLIEIGRDLPRKIWNGILQMGQWLQDRVSGFFRGIFNRAKSALGLSDSAAYDSFEKAIGEAIPQSVAAGIAAASPVATAAAETMAREITTTTTGTLERETPRAAGAARNMSKSVFEEAVAWIEKYRRSSDHSMEEELRMWEYLTYRYAEGTDERHKIDQNMLRLREQILREQDRQDQERFDNSRRWIELRKRFGMLSLQEEVMAWEHVQARYVEGTRQRKDAEFALLDARKRMAAEHERLSNDMATAEERLTQAVERATQARFNQFGLVQRLNTTQEQRMATAESLNQRAIDIEERLQAVRSSTSEDFERLARDEKRLLKELADAQKAHREAEALARMSDAQLFLQGMEERLEIARDFAAGLVSLAERGIGEDVLARKSKEEIAIMYKMTQGELEQFQYLWQAGMELAGEMAVRETADMRKEIYAEIQEMYDDLNELVAFESPEVGDSMIQYIIDRIMARASDLSDGLGSVVSNAISYADSLLSSFSAQGFGSLSFAGGGDYSSFSGLSSARQDVGGMSFAGAGGVDISAYSAHGAAPISLSIPVNIKEFHNHTSQDVDSLASMIQRKVLDGIQEFSEELQDYGSKKARGRGEM